MSNKILKDYIIGDSVLHIIVEYFIDPFFDEIAKAHYYDDISSDLFEAFNKCLDHHGICSEQVISFEISTHRMYLKKRKRNGKYEEVLGGDP